ncbi:MAG: hypothetical protein KatS3mg112_1520 [Thermogutta sp.]|nr:MAG: hypothetical protein KatS3mg112_1520 [Thermogutta sp.]
MRLSIFCLSIVLACSLSQTVALCDTSDRPLGLLDRIENFGEKLFSGIRPARKARATDAQAEAAEPSSSRRAGSAFVDEDGAPLTPRPDPLVSGEASPTAVPADARPTSGASPTGAALRGRSGEPHLAQPVLQGNPRDSGGSSAPQRPMPAASTNETPARAPLYQRLMEYRQSPFTSGKTVATPQSESLQTAVAENTTGRQQPVRSTLPEAPAPAATSTAKAAPPDQPRQSSTTLAERTSTPDANSSASGRDHGELGGAVSAESRVWPQTVAARPVETPSVQSQRPTGATSPVTQAPVSGQSLVQNASRVSDTSRGVSLSPAANIVGTQSGQALTVAGTHSPTPAKPAASVQSGKDVASAAPTPVRSTEHRVSGTVSGVLSGPVLVVNAVGPKSITLGKPGSYEIHLKNQGGAEANDVRVTVAIPRWAEVAGYEASAGDAATTPDANGTTLVWTLPTVGAGKSEKLSLELIPRESQTIDLAIQYTFAPPRTETRIEVREPKLQVEVEGPHEVLFGRSEVYRMVVSNVGTADAEDVTVAIQPLNKAQKEPITQLLGNLAPGQKRLIELELVARETGKMLLSIDATAAGNIAAHTDHEIAIVKPDLSVSLSGPSLQFVGQSDEYVVTVENPGTAPAENVRVQLRHSSAVEPVRRALQGARIDEHLVSWTIPTLPPGDKQSFQIPCQFLADGEARLMVEGMAEGGLTAQSSLVTVVQAVPNLVLDVEGPGRPLPVGQQGTYRIVVENKGSKAATDVFVVGFFSEGIEPVAAEGTPHKILPGQVVFNKIEQIAPGQKLVLTVRAQAQQPGNHIFRAEVRCPSSATQLAFETTSHYFDPAIATRPPVSQSSQVR